MSEEGELHKMYCNAHFLLKNIFYELVRCLQLIKLTGLHVLQMSQIAKILVLLEKQKLNKKDITPMINL